MSRQPQRPLSPHIQIYEPQITSVLSILHRATGIVLFGGTFLWALWFMVLATSPEIYEEIRSFLTHPLGRIFLIGWSFSFFYYFFSEIRYLAWDLGYGYDMKTVRLTGWTIVILSFGATGLVWLFGGIGQ